MAKQKRNRERQKAKKQQAQTTPAPVTCKCGSQMRIENLNGRKVWGCKNCHRWQER